MNAFTSGRCALTLGLVFSACATAESLPDVSPEGDGGHGAGDSEDAGIDGGASSSGGAASGGAPGTGGMSSSTGGTSSSTGGSSPAGGDGGGGGSGGSEAPDGSTGGAPPSGAGGSVASGGSGNPGDPATGAGWLHTEENRILHDDGRPFRGRGANLFDTRSCDACSWLDPNPDGVKAWADVLIDDWHANFIRFNLWAFADDAGYRKHWRSLADDPEYYDDIRSIVGHMTGKPGVYVLVTLFTDPSMNPDGVLHATWPTDATLPVYQKLAEAFVDDPKVLFGLMNEPHDDASQNGALAAIFSEAIQTIRDVEKAAGVPQHIVVAQATQLWARDLSYWVDNPLTVEGGTNIAYETHPYNPPSDFGWVFVEPSKHIPVIIGEFGWSPHQTIEESRTLMQVAEENGVPWIAWSFHQRCPPNLLEDEGGAGYDGCGLSGAGTEFTFEPTEYGQAIKDRLAQPW